MYKKHLSERKKILHNINPNNITKSKFLFSLHNRLYFYYK